MATQYTPILQFALPVTGEINGTWGDVVNDNITSMVEQAIAGMATISTWTTNSHTLTTANGTTDEARCAMLVAQTGAGGTALTGAGNIVCPDRTKLYVLKNASSYAVTLKTSAGTGVAVAAGDTAFLFCDGTNVNACVTQIVNGHITGNLTVDGNTTLGNATSDTITATARIASDLNPSADNTYDLGTSGNSWRNLYIDGTATIATLNVTTIDTTNLEVTNIKAKDGTASATIADATGVMTIGSSVLTTTDINGGTIDGTTVGASSASTGRFTQVNITGQGDLRLEDTSGGEYVALQAPGTLAASYTLTMPADDGTNGQALITDGAGNLSWSTAVFGDVYGPASSTDNAVARFDLTTGKLIQNSGVIIDDSNNVTGVAALTTSGALTLSAGTANGVAYLNGSNVLTTGSALTFDGSIIDTNVSGSTALRLTSSTAQAYISLTSATAGSAPFIGFNNGTGALGSIAAISGGGLSFASGNTERMRLESNNTLTLGLGTNGTAPVFVVNGGTDGANGPFIFGKGNSNNEWFISSLRGATGGGALGMVDYVYGANPRVFYTNSTERMRIDSSGRLIVGGTTSNGTITGDAGSTSGGTGLASRGGGVGSTGGQIVMINTYAGVSNGDKYLRVNNGGEFEIVNSAYSAAIFSLTNGGAAYNTTGTWGTISDERIKENIQDSRGYLDDLCKLRVVKYSLKSEESQTPTKLGFIAQEVEQVFPNMIEESLDTFGDLDKIKQVKMSILTPMLVKALQEQQAIITDLKARIETLEAK